MQARDFSSSRNGRGGWAEADGIRRFAWIRGRGKRRTGVQLQSLLLRWKAGDGAVNGLQNGLQIRDRAAVSGPSAPCEKRFRMNLPTDLSMNLRAWSAGH